MEQLTSEQDELNLQLSLRTSAVSPEQHSFFLCMYRDRKFLHPQALGGHQNEHKRERSIAKRRRQIAAMTYATAARMAAAGKASSSEYGYGAVERADDVDLSLRLRSIC